MTCTASGTATTGNYSNTGTARGSFIDSAGGVSTVTHTDASSYFGADPQISINKVTVDGSSEGDGRTILSGEPISWKYTIANSGNVTLANVTVSDSEAGVTRELPEDHARGRRVDDVHRLKRGRDRVLLEHRHGDRFVHRQCESHPY